MTALSPRQRRILERLAEHPGPVDRWALTSCIGQHDYDDGALRTYISRIRDVLGQDAIATARHVGYQLTEKGRAAYALLCAA